MIVAERVIIVGAGGFGREVACWLEAASAREAKPAIAGFLEDAQIVEVMLNPDGRLWIDRLSEGLSDTGERLSAADGERIVRLVAHHVGVEVHAKSPRVSAELPEGAIDGVQWCSGCSMPALAVMPAPIGAPE